MCGIATISIGKRSRGRIPYETLRSLTKELMLEIELRGVDASGIAVINDEGVESQVFKKPLRADRFVVRKTFEATLQTITNQTNFIMLHTRAASVGTTGLNFNNHPIIVPPIVGIHNGTLHNDVALFRKFKECFGQEGVVDSEIIFKLYLHFADMGMGPIKAMTETGKLLDGAFTGALVDMRDPRQMVMFKNERSLCLFSLPYYDVVIAVSEAKFYDRAASRLKIAVKDRCEGVLDGTGIFVDLDVNRRITDHIDNFQIPIPPEHRTQYSNWLTGL